ncbi:unnamed protein product, partial [Cyprideis torosa]
MPSVVSGKNGDFDEAANLFKRWLYDLTNSPPLYQIGVGTTSGLTGLLRSAVGYTFMKVGRMAAFLTGGAILVGLLASHGGYLTINWDRLFGRQNQNLADQLTRVMEPKVNELMRRGKRSGLSWKDYKLLGPSFVAGTCLGIIMFTMETDLPVWYQECLACLREELEEPQSFTMFESHGDCNALLQKITALLKSVLDRALSRVEGRESVPERSQVKDAVSAPLMYPTVAVNSLRVKLEEREREVGGGNKASLGETSVSVVQDSPSFVEYSLTELGLTDVSSAFVQLHGEQSSSMLIQEPCGELSEDISTQTQGTMHKRKKVIPAEKCLSYVHNEALESHCPMCGKTCYGGHIKRHLENHVRKASQTQSKPKIPCDICGKVIQRKRMKQHKAQVHGRKVSCSKCGQNVAERCIAWHMKRHEKHPENRCQECGRNFTDLLTLKVHFQKLHMPQEDWIVCEQCGKSMPPISLKAHTERYHTPAASCPICHKVLRSTASLKAHMSLNHRENAKKHQCTMCG